MPEVGQPKVTRLHDLVVHEVSLVDKPANQRQFLIVKSAEANTGDVPKEENAMPTDATATDTEKTNEAVDDAMAAKAKEDTTLVTEIDPELQAALGESLDKAGDRLKSLAASVKSAKTAEKAFDSSKKPQIPAKLMQEVVNIRAGLGSMIGKAEDDDDVTKAKEMADPDKEKEVEGKAGEKGKKGKPAFLKEKEDGEPTDADKGDKGKVKSDKADTLFEMLEKFAAMDLDAGAMKMLYSEAACKFLYQAADNARDGDMTMAAKACGMAMKLIGAMGSSDVAMAEKIDEIGKALSEAEDVEKAGRKMSAARWKELDKSLRSLLELAEQIRPGYKAELTGVNKSASNPNTIQQLIDLVRKKDDEIKTLKSSRPVPSSEGAGENSQAASRPFRWANDLNADYNDPDFPEDLTF